MKKFDFLKKHPYFIIFITSLLLYFIFLSPFSVRGHDTYFHLANIQALKEYISKHFFTNSIANIIANNFGYGIRIFYPSLAHIIIAFIAFIGQFIGLNLITSAKIFNLLTLFLSGCSMYMLLKKMYKSKKSAYLGTLVYMSFPYHLSEIFVRDAISENLTFIFIPLILLGIIHLLDNNLNKFYLYFIPATVLLIYSHLVLTVFCALLFSIYIIYNYKEFFIRKRLIPLLKAFLIISILVSPFIIPMLEHKIKGSYVVFGNNTMSTIDTIMNNRLGIIDLLFSPYADNINFSINVTVLIGFIYAIYQKIKYPKQKIKYPDKKIFIPTIIIGIISTFLLSKLAPWNIFPSFLLLIQFPWRLQTLFIFAISILIPIVTNHLKERFYILVCVLTIIIALLNTSSDRIETIKYIENNKNSYEEIWENGMGWQKEYLPIKAEKNFDYLKNRNDDVKVIEGSANINIIKNDTPFLKFEISNNTESIIELPRIYYLGYDISLNDNKLSYYENDKGFIQLKIKGNGNIIVNYSGTKLYKLCVNISTITIILIAVYYIRKKVIKKV